ncbi:MAG: hypothetical protein WBA89_07150 [Microcoleus sp.]|uniref:hypothetical protein n=1 Tax=Microcoleus sp. TaxID=44472 RepID=UPI003C758458
MCRAFSSQNLFLRCAIDLKQGAKICPGRTGPETEFCCKNILSQPTDFDRKPGFFGALLGTSASITQQRFNSCKLR